MSRSDGVRPILLPGARQSLLRALAALGASDVGERARAALAVAQIAAATGIDWSALIQPDPRAEIVALLENPHLPQDDRDTLAGMLAWRRIGKPGARIVAEITRRLTEGGDHPPGKA